MNSQLRDGNCNNNSNGSGGVAKNARPVPPLKILILDDEAILVMDLEFAIAEAGHIVLEDAPSTVELNALEMSSSPDLMPFDVHLAEGSSGLDASLIVRKRWSEACIVFVTANPTVVPYGYAGSHGVIAKPFSHRGLLSAFDYWTAGICDPPPLMPTPSSLIEFGVFNKLPTFNGDRRRHLYTLVATYLLPYNAITDFAETRKMKAVRVPGLTFLWVVASSKERPLTAAGTMVIRIMQQLAARHQSRV